MVDSQVYDRLKAGAKEWNHWRGTTAFAPVDLAHADLGGMNLNDYSFVRADLSGANLARAQLEYAHLKDAQLVGATLTGANLEGVGARNACFDNALAVKANFEVSTLRGASFRNAVLKGARFHRAYLRGADLTGANLSKAWLRFATLDHACCESTCFTGADLRHGSMVKVDIRGADLSDVQVFGISAWSLRIDAATRQDLIVSTSQTSAETPLRAHDLHTAQLLALMLDPVGVRRVFDSVNSSLVLILGSFAPAEKPALDALRSVLQRLGYVAVTFDFERPSERDYAETVVTLAGLARFVVADFSNAKEVRAEVLQLRSQFRRIPIVPIAKLGSMLPVTMANVFSAEELQGLMRYADADDLSARVRSAIVEPALARAASIAAHIARAEAVLRGGA